MTTISKTAALKSAAKTVTQINRRSTTDYVFYVDRDVTNPRGGSMEVRTSSYDRALIKRSEWISINALEIMGKLDEESQHAVHNQAEDDYESHTAKSMLESGLAKFGTGSTPQEIQAGAAAYWDSL